VQLAGHAPSGTDGFVGIHTPFVLDGGAVQLWMMVRLVSDVAQTVESVPEEHPSAATLAHDEPPLEGNCKIARVLNDTAFPHVAVQGDQSEYGANAQLAVRW